jgi:hypothetical protein
MKTITQKNALNEAKTELKNKTKKFIEVRESTRKCYSFLFFIEQTKYIFLIKYQSSCLNNL